MPGSELLFDTNAFIAWIAEDRGLARVAAGGKSLAITLFSLGELYFGALKSSRPRENLEDFRTRLQPFRLLSPDEGTADLYARTCLTLRKKGRPIPDNDVWIAALAMQHELPILTKDDHFQSVDGLKVLGW